MSLLLSAQWDAFQTEFGICMADTSLAGDPALAFALSDDCTGCYGAEMQCVAEFCLSACAANPDDERCVTCRDTAGCNAGFEACSGLPAR